MKTPARPRFLAALAPLLALTIAALAQDTPAPAPDDRPDPAQEAASTQPTPSAPAAEQPGAAMPPAAEPAASESDPAPASPEAESAPSELRRLDQPTPDGTVVEEPGETEATKSTAETASEPAAVDTTDAPAAPQQVERSKGKRSRHGRGGDERVSFWQDSTLGVDEEARAVVSIVGSSTSAGKVHDAVVSILGSSTSSGEVANAVVSVFGSSRVTGGTVGDAVVSVLGNTYVNARVRGEVVAVLGNVELGPDADIGGEVVCVGGRVIRDPAAVVHGQVNNVAFGVNFGGFEWLHAWIAQCLLYGRPLAFGPNLMWAWWIALGFFALYLIFALLFPRGIVRCAETLETRPGFSILTAFLVTLLTPAAAVLLVITVIGTPALVVALIVAGLFGKAVMFAWVGRRITKFAGEGPLSHPFAAVAIGGVIMLLLYTLPVVGFLVAKLSSWLGVGVVVYTLILIMQRNKAAARPALATAGIAPTVTAAAGSDPSNVSSAAFAGVTPTEGAALPPPAIPPVVSAVTQARAGFWIRIAASLIDAAIVAVAVNLFPDRWEPNFLLMFTVYCVVLWATKATTIGGIVCSLKVVRLDDRPLDWPTALVRALGGFVSLIPAGLGFIWVAFDEQRQSWHDKIAGTTVVYVPKGVSLL